jgi:hypothetical protein
MSFAALAQGAVDAVFAVRGVPATYTPPAGMPAGCTVILSDVDPADRPEFAGRLIVKGHFVKVRSSEIAAPVRGGTFSIDGAIFAVVGDPYLDLPARLVWTCMVA